MTANAMDFDREAKQGRRHERPRRETLRACGPSVNSVALLTPGRAPLGEVAPAAQEPMHIPPSRTLPAALAMQPVDRGRAFDQMGESEELYGEVVPVFCRDALDRLVQILEPPRGSAPQDTLRRFHSPDGFKLDATLLASSRRFA